MNQFIDKSHNVTVLFYHLVFPAKYRRVVIDSKVDKQLWGGEFWSDGYFASSVGKHRDGGEYEALHKDHQLSLF